MWKLTQASELTLDLIQSIADSDPFDSSRTNVEQILELAKLNKVQIWVYWDGDTKGTVITELHILADQTRELFVWRVGGMNMLDAFEKVDDLLEQFAKTLNCSRLRTFSQNHRFPVMQERMQHQGWQPSALEMIKEI